MPPSFANKIMCGLPAAPYTLAEPEGEGEMTTRYIVRDRATLGCDFLVWGDGDREAAEVSLHDAIADGLDVELVKMPADKMDPHTQRLIEG